MIAICWLQLPIYAARCIGAFVERTNEEVAVFRVPSARFPIERAEEMTHAKVFDVRSDECRPLSSFLTSVPDVIVVSGWSAPVFLRWMKDVRRNGGKTIVCTDEHYRGRSIREIIRRIRFMLLFKRWIDYLFITGRGGIRQFADNYGLPLSMMRVGVYAGDPKLFFDGETLSLRPKKFVYVGHFDENKNVIKMCKAFKTAAAGTNWGLEVYGGGPLEEELREFEGDGVTVRGYVNADQLGPIYRNARGFILGSYREQWGVVVHEACMSGCMLVLSEAIGARYDLATQENSVIFNPASEAEFTIAIRKVIDMSDSALDKAHDKSIELARQFSPEVFASNLNQLIIDARKSK